MMLPVKITPRQHLVSYISEPIMRFLKLLAQPFLMLTAGILRVLLFIVDLGIRAFSVPAEKIPGFTGYLARGILKTLNWQRRSIARLLEHPNEAIIESAISVCGAASVVFIVLIMFFLIKDALPLFRYVSVTSVFFGKDWYPTSSPPQFGLLPLLVGSFLITAGAVVLAVPTGIAAAVYIAELAPDKVREWLKVLVEMIAAFPSVVIGFIGLVIVVPWIKNLFDLSTGQIALTASIMLAWMAMPTIVSIAEDAIKAVPKDYREGSLALGTTNLQTIRYVILPAAKSGIIAAVMLGIGRAIGETMTVLMVAGGAAQITGSLLKPVRGMTQTIAAEMGEVAHYTSHYHALFTVGAVLFIITFIINLIADSALRKEIRE